MRLTKTFRNGEVHTLKPCCAKYYHKLSQLEDIEDELGVELITLLEVLMEKRTFFTKLEDGTIIEDSMDKDAIYEFCKIYGKTWALDKKELK